jgi:hypothetical protein
MRSRTCCAAVGAGASKPLSVTIPHKRTAATTWLNVLRLHVLNTNL